MKTFAQWVLALTRGYIKATGKRPNKLDQLRIKMEAGQKVKDQKKVVDMEGNVLDPNKPIMGGRQVEEGPINWDEVNKIDIEDFAGGGIAGMLGERTGYKEGREAQRRPLSDREDWYTDKIIADNLGRIKNAMYMKYILPEKWSRSLESLTDEDFYGEYDERKGHTGIFKKFFETKEGEKIDLPYKPDEGVDVTGLLEAMEGKGVSKDYKVKKRKSIELKGGGIAGMLGEPTYQDDNHRVPYGGGGAGKPPITFTLQGGGSYGSNEIGPGLDLTQSGYGFNLGAEIGLPWGFSATGGVGIGRGKTEVDYNDQNVFTGVDETKLGDKWNVGLKWSKEFNEGGRVPFDSGNMVLPKEKPFQGLFHTEVGGPVITKDDSEFESVVDRWSQFARQQGEGPEDAKRNKTFALENIVRIGKELGYEDDEIKEIILRINKASGGRVPLKGGKLALLEGLEALFKKFFPGTTKIGKRSRPYPEKVQETMDLRKALADFQKREKAAAKFKTWEDPDKVRAAVDDIFPSGDYKYDAEMASQALVENNPKAFGNKLFDDLDQDTQLKIYGKVVEVVQNDLGKMLQLKRATKPTKTLKGIEETGTIDISDPNIAEEFTKFMKETDPKGYAKIQKVVDDANQQLELKRFKKPKGKKGHASGGLAGMLGE